MKVVRKRWAVVLTSLWMFGTIYADVQHQQQDTIVYPFYNGFAKVMTEHVGIIDTTGKEVLPILYFDAPEYFGENQFRPIDPHSSECIGFVVDYDESAVWFDSKGTILLKEGKPFYGMSDTIPDVLWNY